MHSSKHRSVPVVPRPFSSAAKNPQTAAHANVQLISTSFFHLTPLLQNNAYHAYATLVVDSQTALELIHLL